MGNTKSKHKRECDDCGEYIQKERLKLVPDTDTCVVCQEYREKDGKFQRHRMVVNYTQRCGEIEETEETLVRAPA